jgi:hypothetical protein
MTFLVIIKEIVTVMHVENLGGWPDYGSRGQRTDIINMGDFTIASCNIPVINHIHSLSISFTRLLRIPFRFPFPYFENNYNLRQIRTPGDAATYIIYGEPLTGLMGLNSTRAKFLRGLGSSSEEVELFLMDSKSLINGCTDFRASRF